MTERSGKSDPFVEDVARFIDAEKLISPRAGVVVGVSGGLDSVALLAVLRALQTRPQRGYRLTVAHLNHQLRDGSDEDAKFVTDLGRGWDLPCIVASRDVPAEARRLGAGIEQAARTTRYAFLRETAEKVAADYVAVAHHADDNVETILYRIMRGTHIRGLTGIPFARSLEGTDIQVVRPLLPFPRSAIEDFARRARLTWRTDPTNADVGFRRNFIRHKLLPLLRQELNPRTDEALLRLARAAKEVEALLVSQGDAALQRCQKHSDSRGIVLERKTLEQETPIVRAYVLRAVLQRLGAPMRTMGTERFDDLRELLDPAGPTAVSLPGGIVARREGEEIIIETGTGTQVRPDVVALECPGRTPLPDGREIICELGPFDRDEFEAHCASPRSGVEMLDADQIRGDLTSRPRRRGDAFVPLGAPGTQTVSDFLTNLKLPRRRREHVRCICDELGLVYLAPLRIDDRVRVTHATRRVLRIEIRGGEP